MATRRSARLRGETPNVESQQSAPRSPSKLAAVMESPGAPAKTKQKIPSVPSTPKTKQLLTVTTPQSNNAKINLKTPNSSGSFKPRMEETNPSKARQSTPKQRDTGFQLGTRPTPEGPKAPGQSIPSLQNTPSKGRVSNADELKAMSFDFKFSCGDSQLSDDAKKLMDNIREDAARIKANMIIEQNAQKRENGEAEGQPGGRKIAKAKGRASRYSEAHMTQFKKMDSIAGHPSSFRARAENSRVSPVKSLKRTSSKAQLDELERNTPSKIRTTPGTGRTHENIGNDRSLTRPPLSSGAQIGNTAPSKSMETDSSKLVTPQKSIIPRTTSVRHPHTTKAPSMSRSPSRTTSLGSKTPQTDIIRKYKMSIPRVKNPKSILRRPQPLFSNDPVKIAAGTHQAPPSTSFENKLLGLPQTPQASSVTPSAKKRVDFSASTKLRDACNGESPSVSKAISSEVGGDVVYPNLPLTTSPHVNRRASFIFKSGSPTIRKVNPPTKPSQATPFSGLSPIPHGIINKKRRREEAEEEPQTPKEDRVIKRVKPNPSTPTVVKTPSPVKRRLPPHGTPRRGTPARSTPRSTAQRDKGISLSRLNFLATPKGRR